MLANVVELRIEATGGWQRAPYTLTLVILVKPGVLPMFADDDLPDLPVELGSWLHGSGNELARGPAEIADRLTVASDPTDRYFLWVALGEAWAARCQPAGEQPAEVIEAVESISSEVLSTDEHSLARSRRSEQLDLDHLSPPLKD